MICFLRDTMLIIIFFLLFPFPRPILTIERERFRVLEETLIKFIHEFENEQAKPAKKRVLGAGIRSLCATEKSAITSFDVPDKERDKYPKDLASIDRLTETLSRLQKGVERHKKNDVSYLMSNYLIFSLLFAFIDAKQFQTGKLARTSLNAYTIDHSKVDLPRWFIGCYRNNFGYPLGSRHALFDGKARRISRLI